ncbi:GNAT family N-acetyltransferase [Saccharospirillum sp.]|uniref:GNAT family N-acetyltransferase n=1 Tax=Saccharospirillum sp. TaxID=2033801 RepID=UPI0034A0A700
MAAMDLNDVEVMALDERCSRQARSLLYHSYKDEPTFNYLLDSSRPGYKQRIRATIRELIHLHFERGETVLGVVHKQDRRVLGVAFVSDVGLKMDISRQFLWRLKMTLTAGFESTRRYIQYFNDVQSSLPNMAHRTVSLIGIHPEFQKQGLGRLLMETVHQQVSNDAQSIGVFLDTGNNRYLTFYETLGYERFADIKMGTDLTEVVLFRANPNYVEAAA